MIWLSKNNIVLISVMVRIVRASIHWKKNHQENSSLFVVSVCRARVQYAVYCNTLGWLTVHSFHVFVNYVLFLKKMIIFVSWNVFFCVIFIAKIPLLVKGCLLNSLVDGFMDARLKPPPYSGCHLKKSSSGLLLTNIK